MRNLILSSTTAARIGALVRLLASDQSGEIVAAADALKRTLAGVGTDLHHLADIAERGLTRPPNIRPPDPPPSPDPDPKASGLSRADVYAMTDFLWRNSIRLSDKENSFATNLKFKMLNDGRHTPSVRQVDWLISIYTRLRGAAS